MLAIILLSVFGIVLLYLGFLKSRAVLLPATLLFILIALGSCFLEWNKSYLYFGDMLLVSNMAILFIAIVLISAFMVVSLSGDFLEDENAQPAEYYSILLFSIVGAIMMIGYENLIMLFVGIEILSVSMYILTGSDKRNLRSNEAALKYFLMGAFATGILLFGMGLLYGAAGSFVLTDIQAYIALSQGRPSLLLYMGLVLVLIGMLFKVSAAPFHFWTPDVYEGAPTLFTAFMSTVVKTAGFAALYQLLSVSFSAIYGFWWIILTVITGMTLLIGNLTAVYQTSFKRMMAYSSISHAGYLLIGLAALGQQSKQAIVFYSLAYSVATIAAFGILLIIEKQSTSDGRTDDTYAAFNGLSSKNPLLAFILTVSMLSLAGIPLTAGFWGKFMLFSVAIDKGMVWILVLAVLMSAVGIYYYFRVVIAMYFREGTSTRIQVAPFFRFVLIAATVLTIILGLFPGLFQDLL